MSEYKRSAKEKTEYYTGNLGKAAKTKSGALLVTVKICDESTVSYENYVRIENAKPLLRDGITNMSSITINPTFVKLTAHEAELYKSYLFSGKDGLYKNLCESMKKRGVL